MVAIVIIRSEELVGYILFSTVNVLKKGNGRVKLANLQLRRMVRKPESSMAAFKRTLLLKLELSLGRKSNPRSDCHSIKKSLYSQLQHVSETKIRAPSGKMWGPGTWGGNI